MPVSFAHCHGRPGYLPFARLTTTASACPQPRASSFRPDLAQASDADHHAPPNGDRWEHLCQTSRRGRRDHTSASAPLLVLGHGVGFKFASSSRRSRGARARGVRSPCSALACARAGGALPVSRTRHTCACVCPGGAARAWPPKLLRRCCPGRPDAPLEYTRPTSTPALSRSQSHIALDIILRGLT
jgi:hypothetical protein